MVYKIKPSQHTEDEIRKIAGKNPEIRFVSLMGIDLYGNYTEERIPIKVFLGDLHKFLTGIAVQTDGSSVALPGIATLNNAKIDMKADLDVDWFIDYNYSLKDEATGNPVGTIVIPAFLYHNGIAVDSRSILKSAEEAFKNRVLELAKDCQNFLTTSGLKKSDIENVTLDTAAELEFWVKTPNDKAEIEALTVSENLQEQYWSKIYGPVRTALENTLILMDTYGLEPEMGHKEVGGIKAKLGSNGKYNHVMEQLEVDWKYSGVLQTSDNQLFVKNLIEKTFILNGLETTFMSKPIDDVAGNGMHLHLGAKLKLKNGKMVNLFNGEKGDFLGVIGYGALMGILKNYEIINPFISATHDSLKRLKPGYEAPVCVVSSIGISKDMPSRNRTVLVALIRDEGNPKATRFELRSPNPRSNIYLATAATYLSMLDGIEYVVRGNKTAEELLCEISKESGEYYGYLEQDRKYRSEEDVFSYYTEEERNRLFGVAPKSVYENLENFSIHKDKLNILKVADVFTDTLINSYRSSVLTKWREEISKRIISNYVEEIKELKPLREEEHLCEKDLATWEEIDKLLKYIAKNTDNHTCLFSRIKNAIAKDENKLASDLSIELEEKMDEVRKMYFEYAKNIF